MTLLPWHVLRMRELHVECVQVGVIHDYALRELRLFTDYGRTSRPLFIVEEGNQLAFKRHHLQALIER